MPSHRQWTQKETESSERERWNRRTDQAKNNGKKRKIMENWHPCTQTCMHSCMHTHTHTEACMHTQSHTHAHTHTHADTHTCAHTHTHTCLHTSARTQTHTYTHTTASIIIFLTTRTPPQIVTQPHTNTHLTHTHTYIEQLHIHTHTLSKEKGEVRHSSWRVERHTYFSQSKLLLPLLFRSGWWQHTCSWNFYHVFQHSIKKHKKHLLKGMIFIIYHSLTF